MNHNRTKALGYMDMYLQGHTVTQVAKHFGVKYNTVYDRIVKLDAEAFHATQSQRKKKRAFAQKQRNSLQNLVAYYTRTGRPDVAEQKQTQLIAMRKAAMAA